MFGHAGQQFSPERGLVAPARRLRDAGHTFELPRALIALPAQRAARGVNGLGFWHHGLGAKTCASHPRLDLKLRVLNQYLVAVAGAKVLVGTDHAGHGHDGTDF